MSNPHFNVPYTKIVAVTPSDSVSLAPPADALYVSVAGNIALVDIDGNASTIAAVAGAILPIKTSRVNLTGTTATVFAMYLP